ncbi:MAG TPA: RraA family protein [Phycisphaerae bacterium]|nr:RraA family protein [Phycisphaerae bacterium]
MENSTDSVKVAERLGRIPTTIACDILRDEDLGDRVVTGLRPVTNLSASIAGPVRLIEFLPGRPELRRPGPPANFLLIDELEPGEVLMLCAGGSMKGAVLGDMLATRAKACGAQGALVDGAVRDLDGLAESGLPVQARGVAPMAAHATLIPFDCRHPVCFAGVTVLPDDWVLADRDGALVLTRPLVDLLLDRQATTMARDAFSQGLIREGFPLRDVFPLPAGLMPFLDDFRQSGAMPDPIAVRRVLSGGT